MELRTTPSRSRAAAIRPARSPVERLARTPTTSHQSRSSCIRPPTGSRYPNSTLASRAPSTQTGTAARSSRSVRNRPVRISSSSTHPVGGHDTQHGCNARGQGTGRRNTAIEQGADGHRPGQQLPQKAGVLEAQCGRAFEASAPDDDVAEPELLNLLQDFLAGALSYRQHRDHRGDTQHDAEGTQRGAQSVSTQRFHADTYDLSAPVPRRDRHSSASAVRDPPPRALRLEAHPPPRHRVAR